MPTKKLDLSWMDPPQAPDPTKQAKKQKIIRLPSSAELACSECGDPMGAWWLYQGFRYCFVCAPEWLRKPTETNLPKG